MPSTVVNLNLLHPMTLMVLEAEAFQKLFEFHLVAPDTTYITKEQTKR